MQAIKVTYILKGVTDVFYQGNGDGGSIEGLLNKADAEKFAYLNEVRHVMGFTQKIGSGQFRDAVELNARMRTNPTFAFSLEPRKGYKLATFLIS